MILVIPQGIFLLNFKCMFAFYSLYSFRIRRIFISLESMLNSRFTNDIPAAQESKENNTNPI